MADEQDMYHLVLTRLEAQELCDLTTLGITVVLRETKDTAIPEVIILLGQSLTVRELEKLMNEEDYVSVTQKLRILSRDLVHARTDQS